jgi:hypothetical protein
VNESDNGQVSDSGAIRSRLVPQVKHSSPHRRVDRNIVVQRACRRNGHDLLMTGVVQAQAAKNVGGEDLMQLESPRYRLVDEQSVRAA